MPPKKSTIRKAGNFSFGKRPAFRKQKCETCGGSGELDDLVTKQAVKCEDCKGRGVQ